MNYNPLPHREHVTFVSPHPKSLSLWERDFEVLLPFFQWEKGLGDEGCSFTCKPDMLPPHRKLAKKRFTRQKKMVDV
jgi:hypothetical protein